MGDDGSGWGPPFLTPTRALAAVVALFVVLSSAVLLLTPPWEANDEPDHVRNAMTLAQGEWYRIEGAAGLQPHQPPLYYLALAGWTRVLGVDDSTPEPRPNPAAFFAGPLYFHSAEEEAQARALRWPSVAAGAAVVVLTFACARRLTDDRWTPVVAAATVATIPRFVFLSGVVNNDNLAILLGALLTYVCIRLCVAPPDDRARRHALAAALGAISGAMLLTKLSAAPLAAGALAAAVVVGRRRREAVTMVAAVAGAAVVVAGWWLVWNVQRYGDPLASDASNEYLRRFRFLAEEERTILELAFWDIPRTLYDSFFYISGWNQLRWKDGWHLPFWVLAVVPLLGWFRRPAEERSHRTRRALGVTAVIAGCAIGALWFVGLFNTALPGTLQARLVFPGLAAFGALVAIGWQRLGGPLLLRFALPLLGLAGTLYAIWDDVWRVYHR